MDITELMKQLGFSEADIAEAMHDPQFQALIRSPELLDAFSAPSVAETVQQMQAIFGIQHDAVLPKAEPFDLDAAVSAYDPMPADGADCAFLAAMQRWLSDSLREIPAQDVCMLAVCYEASFDDDGQVQYAIRLGFNTAENAAKNRARFGTEVWCCTNWTDDLFRQMPDAPFAAWRAAHGYDENNDGDGMIGRVYDLAAAAVTALHREQITEQLFGRKVPFIIEGLEFDAMTAVRAVKANGAALFDKQFFADCGVSPDDTDEQE